MRPNLELYVILKNERHDFFFWKFSSSPTVFARTAKEKRSKRKLFLVSDPFFVLHGKCGICLVQLLLLLELTVAVEVHCCSSARSGIFLAGIATQNKFKHKRRKLCRALYADREPYCEFASVAFRRGAIFPSGIRSKTKSHCAFPCLLTTVVVVSECLKLEIWNSISTESQRRLWTSGVMAFGDGSN